MPANGLSKFVAFSSSDLPPVNFQMLVGLAIQTEPSIAIEFAPLKSGLSSLKYLCFEPKELPAAGYFQTSWASASKRYKFSKKPPASTIFFRSESSGIIWSKDPLADLY